MEKRIQSQHARRIQVKTQLSGTHQKTHDRLFQNPLTHNLQWREVSAMFQSMTDVQSVEDEIGNLKVTRNGKTVTIRRPVGKDLSDDNELLRVRHFLEETNNPVKPAAATGTHLLVVIDHREARIFSTELHDSVPHSIKPYDPLGFGRELHYKGDDSNGQRRPELKSFYEAVAKTLSGAQKILLFGTGTDASSAMEQLLLDLKKNHHDVAAKVVGSFSVDEKHLSENQLLAMAREHFVTS